MDDFNQQQAEQNRRALFQKQQEQKQEEEKAAEERQRAEERERKKRQDNQQQLDERMQAVEKLKTMRDEQEKRQAEQKPRETAQERNERYVREAKEKFEYYKQLDAAPGEQQQVPRWQEAQKAKQHKQQRQKYDGIPPGAKAEIAKKLKVATPEEKRRLLKSAHDAQRINKQHRQVDLRNADKMVTRLENAMGQLPVTMRLELKGELADKMQAIRFNSIVNNGRMPTDKEVAKQVEKEFKKEIQQRRDGRPPLKMERESMLEKASNLFDAILGGISDLVNGKQQENAVEMEYQR